jgi:hypothetical protein
MTAAMVGLLVGLVIAGIDYAVLAALARRVELEETRRVLRITGLVQFLFLPVLGWFAAPYLMGD